MYSVEGHRLDPGVKFSLPLAYHFTLMERLVFEILLTLLKMPALMYMYDSLSTVSVNQCVLWGKGAFETSLIMLQNILINEAAL